MPGGMGRIFSRVIKEQVERVIGDIVEHVCEPTAPGVAQGAAREVCGPRAPGYFDLDFN